MMAEIDKSKWGTKVKTTTLAIEKFIFKEQKKGILLAENFGLMRIIPEGRVISRWYSKDFWEVEK